MKRLVAVTLRPGALRLGAAALLGLAAFGPLAANEPLSPDELKASVLKDCKTYQMFCAAKHARIKEALRRGGEGEATQVCERLIAEESRTLKRVIWYLGIDRAQKATRETLEKVLAKVESTPPPDALKATVAGRFAAPAWLSDPFNYTEGDEPKKDEKPEPVISVSSGARSSSSPNYGVAGASQAPAIKPVAAPAPVAPPSEAPPPPPAPTIPLPGGGGENPGGGGSGAGSGAGSHSSQ